MQYTINRMIHWVEKGFCPFFSKDGGRATNPELDGTVQTTHAHLSVDVQVQSAQYPVLDRLLTRPTLVGSGQSIKHKRDGRAVLGHSQDGTPSNWAGSEML